MQRGREERRKREVERYLPLLIITPAGSKCMERDSPAHSLNTEASAFSTQHLFVGFQSSGGRMG